MDKLLMNKILLNEGNEEHPYYEYLSEYGPYNIFYMVMNGENLWKPLINPTMYKKALSEFIEYGYLNKFPKKYIYQWMGIIMKNTAILTSTTEIAGHSTSVPFEDFYDYFFGEDGIDSNGLSWEDFLSEHGFSEDDEYESMTEYLEEVGFYDNLVLPDGSDAWSDYGIEPIEKLIAQYDDNLPAEKVLVLINKILDVYHQRGDLSSMFIDGGSKVLTDISMNEGKKLYKIILNEGYDDGSYFIPNSEWMKEKYDYYNRTLFNGTLGECELLPYTRKESKNLLGCFHFNGEGLKIRLRDRKLFKRSSSDGSEIEINKNNFFEICKPVIELNTHYKASEELWCNILVHEMCHYYTYMLGYVPKQGHGVEFRDIANQIRVRSNGKFNVKRTEEAEGFELDDNLKKKDENRRNNLANRINILIGVSDNRKMRLITTTSQKLVNEIINLHKDKDDMAYLGITINQDLYNFLVSKRYMINMKSYRYWDITNDEETINELSKYRFKDVLNNDCSIEEAIDFMRNGGKAFVEKRHSLSEHISKEIRNVIKEYKKKNTFIDIDPDDNLGLYSPIEKVWS